MIKGTWWVATGNKFDPALAVPMPTGSFVTHFAKQVHWDGAKDEEAWLIIVGEGPAMLTRVEEAKLGDIYKGRWSCRAAAVTAFAIAAANGVRGESRRVNIPTAYEGIASLTAIG